MPEMASAYEAMAAPFARTAGPVVYRLLAQPLVAAIRVALGQRSGPVLDVAAGAGAFGRAFVDAVAVDVAAGVLGHNPARQRVVADATALPFRADSFGAAGCAFGIAHIGAPGLLVREMARVAPVVGLVTWARPDEPYAPKQIVDDAIARQTGASRTPLGRVLDRRGDDVGTVDALDLLLRDAGIEPRARRQRVDVPWPGADAYLDYRLTMPTTAPPLDAVALRREVVEAIHALAPESLVWRPAVVVAAGRRSRPAS
jgi:hypothetical protein